MAAQEVRDAVTYDQYRMPKHPKIPGDIYDIMMKCWEQEGMDRPTFDFLQQHFEHYLVSTEAQYPEADD